MNSDVNIHYKKQYLNRSISCYNNSMMKLKDKGRLTVILNQNNFYKKNIENQKIGQFKNNYVSGEINLMNENDNNNSKNKNKMAKREYYILESYKFLWFLKKDEYIEKLVKFRKVIISEERIYKTIFLIKSLKDKVFDLNKTKDLDNFDSINSTGNSIENNNINKK